MLVSGDPQELAWIERTARQRAAPAMGAVTRLSRARGAGAVSAAAGRAWRRSTSPAARGSTDGVWPRRCCGRQGLMAPRSCGAMRLWRSKRTGSWVSTLGNERIAADRVIVTAGAWVDRVLRPFGFRSAGRTATGPDRASAVRWRADGGLAGHPAAGQPLHRAVRRGADRRRRDARDRRRLRLPGDGVRAGGGAVRGAADRSGSRRGDDDRDPSGFSSGQHAGRPLLGWVRGIEGTGGRQRPRRGWADDRTVRRTVTGGSGDRAAGLMDLTPFEPITGGASASQALR